MAGKISAHAGYCTLSDCASKCIAIPIEIKVVSLPRAVSGCCLHVEEHMPWRQLYRCQTRYVVCPAWNAYQALLFCC